MRLYFCDMVGVSGGLIECDEPRQALGLSAGLGGSCGLQGVFRLLYFLADGCAQQCFVQVVVQCPMDVQLEALGAAFQHQGYAHPERSGRAGSKRILMLHTRGLLHQRNSEWEVIDNLRI